ncbi:MAG: hypothetical protein MUF51_08335 [Vicinamibacteria bacterium]|jgi:hypothetical protein|nr:hypothetical protein [Vicinamibacteria bacterium]
MAPADSNLELKPLARFLLWDYDRGSLPYDVLCIILFLLVVFLPAAWLGDPMVGGR